MMIVIYKLCSFHFSQFDHFHFLQTSLTFKGLLSRADSECLILQALSLEIEKEKFEYLEKSKHLQDQLQTFKSEIDDLKLDEKVTKDDLTKVKDGKIKKIAQVTDLDKLHSQQQTEGENKYSTIQKVAKI